MAEPLGGKSAAMVLEAAARAAGQLVIASTEVLSAARTRVERRVGVSRALYRGGLFALLATLGLIELHVLGHYAADLVGAVNEKPFRQVVAGLLVAALGLCLSGTAKTVAKAYDKHPPEWAHQAEVLAAAAAGVIAGLVA